jgi:antitoxin component YwqK of YwqJK toxin-antitoxin module
MNQYRKLIKSVGVSMILTMFLSQLAFAFPSFIEFFQKLNLEIRVDNDIVIFMNYDYGPIKTYDNNGNLKIDCFVQNSRLHGLCKMYHENGQVWARASFFEGKPDGEMVFYKEDGSLLFQGFSERGVFRGAAKEYDSEKGYLSKKIEYSNDGKTSMITVFDDIGNPLHEVPIKDGVTHGRVKLYYSGSNSVQMEVEYENGSINGMMTEYFENGNKKSEVEFKKGEPIGIYTEYLANGKIKNINNTEKYRHQILSAYTEMNGSIVGLDDNKSLINQKEEKFEYKPLSSVAIPGTRTEFRKGTGNDEER